jgi:hypothetical protein
MKQRWLAPVVTRLERPLLRIDEPPFGAIYRVIIGFTVLPTLSLLGGEDPSGWEQLAFLSALLFGLRVGPAVARKVLPFSDAALSTWRARRQTSKRHDAYQWEKLLWIGIGFAGYAGWSGELTTSTAWLTAACLVSGMAGRLILRSSARSRLSEGVGA